MSAEPEWLAFARRQLDVREIPGPRHSAVILGWLRDLKAWWRDDETPWCGAFVAACLRAAGVAVPPAWYRARAWGDWGVATSPRIGALLVFARGGGGHVGWYVGEDAGHFHVLGGNQSNRVSVARIARGRLLACRWPARVAIETGARAADPSVAALSTSEA